jgi:FixJ family two-component response regulator
MRTTTIFTAPLISVVDDEPAVGRGIQSLLKSLNYAAACFTSAEEYLTSPLRRDTACLILDVNMPGMSGVQLQARLLAEGDRTPIIFITAVADEMVRKRALETGARGFLSKPIDPGSLIGLVGAAVTDTA